MRSRRWRSCLQQVEFHPLALALVFNIEQDRQALEFTLVGQAMALYALVTMALMLSSTLNFITLALTLVLSSAQTRQVPELMLLGQAVALKLPFSSSVRTACSPRPSSTRVRCSRH